ncbi:MAG: cupin domain-containing protein [Streptosporangiaceae bacterium]
MPAALLPAEQAGIIPLLAPPPNVAHGIVSQAVLTAPGLRVTLMHFAAGQELSEHTSSARALVQVLAGSCQITFPGRAHQLGPGDLLHLPPGLPHAVSATGDLTLLLVQAPALTGK